MKILVILVLVSCAFADDIVYSSNETIIGNKYYYENDRVTINQGVTITYNSSADNRGHFTNNGIIAKGEGNSVFSNTSTGTFINNGTMIIGQFNNRGIAYFYGDATALCAYGCNGFGNRGGGTFYIIGATLTGNMEHDDIYNYKGEATNKATNTLIFGIHNSMSSKMGQLNGNFTNKGASSVIQVNIANMIYGQKYTIITGTISGIDTIGFLGANLDEVTTHYDIAKGEVWIEKKSTQPENPDPDKPNPNPNPNPPPQRA